MESDVYFYGIGFGETAEVTVAPGVTMIVELLEITDHVDDQGQREVYFEVNGVRRSVWVKDNSLADKLSAAATKYADPDNPLEVGANIPGNIVKVLVKAGDAVEEGQPIAVIEAMKMETNIISTATGTIADILVKDGAQVKAGELIAVIEQ